MLRVSEETRRRVAAIAKEDFGGATVDETVSRLVDEHWQAKAVAAMRRFREEDPQGWADYVADADRDSSADAPVADEWVGARA